MMDEPAVDKFADGSAPSWLVRFAHRIAIGATLTMLLATVLVVILRYVFAKPSIPLQDLAVWMHATAFMFAIPVALAKNRHVRVDIFYQQWSSQHRAWVELVGAIFLLTPVALFLLWSGWPSVALSWRLLEGSPETGGLPGYFLVKTLILVMPALLLWEGSRRLVRAAATLRGAAALRANDRKGVC